MKLNLLAMIAGVALLIGGGGCAQQNSAIQSAGPNRPNNQQYLTGSYMPQDVQKNGMITNGKDNIRVVGRSELDRSGGADAGQALQQLGVTH